MAPRRESAASRAQGKRPVEPSHLDQSEARRKARYDTALFGYVEDYQRYKQKIRLEKSCSREKHQFLPTSVLWI